ncbi:MAG: hypothetical protein HPY85_04990 [Anaerolineae bacterium]|nr:hypothetical protein [Anaerolineae bacterium]
MTDSDLNPTPKSNFFLKLVIIIGSGLVMFGFLLSVIYQPDRLTLVFFDPTATPTMLTSTPAPTMTNQPSQTPTLTVTPQPTETPFPSSAYAVSDLNAIRPELNIAGNSAIILNEDIAQVEPPLDHFQWISSSDISQDIGYEIAEPYFATFGSGKITWSTDLPVKPALYEIFILDTLFSSGGELDFAVRLDDQLMEPIIGESYVRYQSSQGDPPQYNDVWQSIGIYDVTQIGIISVSSEWSTRDERSIVAVDRVLILEHPAESREILQQLPATGSMVYVTDEGNAAFTSTQFWDYWEDPLSWGGQYQVISDPPVDTSVTWTFPSVFTHATYDVYAWIPSVSGTAPVTYRLFASGLQVADINGEVDIVFADGQGNRNKAAWLHIGTWVIPEVFGDSIRFALNMSVTENTKGDCVVDAIALVRK